jgi:hypothetical protein
MSKFASESGEFKVIGGHPNMEEQTLKNYCLEPKNKDKIRSIDP